MAVADLITENQSIVSGRDSIVIVEQLETMTSGKTLNTTGWTDKHIESGHPVVFKNNDYYPAAVDGSESAQAVGVVISTVLTAKPFVGILVRGTVNMAAVKYPDTINTALQTKLNLIRFTQD